MTSFPIELEGAYLCDVLELTEKELYETSREHIQYRMIVKSQRNKAENERIKQAQKK